MRCNGIRFVLFFPSETYRCAHFSSSFLEVVSRSRGHQSAPPQSSKQSVCLNILGITTNMNQCTRTIPRPSFRSGTTHASTPMRGPLLRSGQSRSTTTNSSGGLEQGRVRWACRSLSGGLICCNNHRCLYEGGAHAHVTLVPWECLQGCSMHSPRHEGSSDATVFNFGRIPW